jgi:hypothetical protein
MSMEMLHAVVSLAFLGVWLIAGQVLVRGRRPADK